MKPEQYNRADANRSSAYALRNQKDLNSCIKRHEALVSRILSGTLPLGEREMTELNTLIEDNHNRLLQLIDNQIDRLDKEFEEL